uniref:Uncharacterized protein TCIL3000_5_410 n=1 Tax=Trypanosoma congolense (strain IL3000) TaxID=1068625 RepID=G0UME8_TRYCI|nr:unnamed protein product [Trypanosoma congolense IL3000]
MRICGNVREALELVKKWDISLLILVHGADTGSTTAEGHQLTCDNIPDFYSARRIHGRKVINTQFQFGCEALRNSGLLQRCALEAVLEESRLSAVAVVHYVEEGSAGHKLFTDAVPEGSNIVPRLHVFPPMVRGAPRTLLHGITLTPLQICIAVRTALQPLSPAEVTAARDMVLQHIDDMNMVWEKLSSSAPDTCGVSSLSKTNTTGAGNTGQVGSSSSSTQAKSKVLLRLKDSCGEVKSSSDARAGDACGGQETVESCGTEGCRVECGATATTGRRELEAAGRPPEEERQAADVPPASSTAVRKESVPATAANSSSGDTINLRCRLPAGDTHIVRNLNPSTATLSADVRGPVAAVVGSSAFVFARPHPPQRFTEEEENKTLESLEIRCSSNILVFPSEDSSAPAGVLQRGFYGGREVLATVSTLFNRVHHSVSGSSAEQPVRSWFRTMADTHEEDEAEDRSERQQDEGRRPSKANRYFGGGSTFYVGKDDSDEESLDEGEADKAKKKQ